MTKQIVTSSESGASGSANSELGVESFERLLKGFQSQLTGFKAEDTVLIGNCPQNVTDEEINKFFCGFATIVKLQRVVVKSLTTNVFIAQFECSESASRSKVLNTLALNGKKILLIQPEEKHIFIRRNVVELNGLQEHSEEVIYDHMSTFGNVSFVLKTNTVTYIVYEELSAVESSCRCDYLDQYPVTIRSVLDSASAGAAGGPGSSIETCILEHIDQNSSLLADEEDGQINNFMQLLDMENLDEYLEQDEKDKSSTSDKPLLEVGNEEIIVTEDEAAHSEGEKEADVAAIEKEALQLAQLQRKRTPGTVLVDNRTQRILKLGGNSLRLTDLPQLNIAVQRVPNKVKIRPKKGAVPTKKHGEQKKKKSAQVDSSANKKDLEAAGDHVKKQKEPDSKARKKESSVEMKKANKEIPSGKEESKNAVKSEKAKSSKKHTKEQDPVTERTKIKTEEAIINESKSEAKTNTSEIVSSGVKKESEHEANANVAEHKHSKDKKHKESKTVQKTEKMKVDDSKPEIAESASKKTEASKEEKKTDIHEKPKVFVPTKKKSAFVRLTKLTPKQIQELSQIRRKTVSGDSVVDGADPDKAKVHGVKKRKPGPAKGAMKEKKPVKEKTKKAEKHGLSDSETEPSVSSGTKDGASSMENPGDTDHAQKKKKKKPKLDRSPERSKLEHCEATQQEQTESSVDEGKAEGTPAEVKSERMSGIEESSQIEEPEIEPEPTAVLLESATEVLVIKEKIDDSDDPSKASESCTVVVLESTTEVTQLDDQEKNSDSVPDLSNTVEINQVDPVADMESDEERPLVMDITFDVPEDIIGQQPPEEGKSDRKVVLLDSRSATVLKGKTHDGHYLFLDVLPRVAVKIRHITESDYKISRPKEHPKLSTGGHHEKHPPKKVSFDSSAVKRKEDKPEKPRKTNLDRIDSKFLPANSKLKSKVRSKTDINHKKHLPVPELPIELKTHLNTSFKIPKKDSSVTPQSIARNSSELNCLHKEQDEEKQRKRFQKERRPREGQGGRDWKQNPRPQPKPVVRQEREPSPVPDYFDPSFDDDNHSPSPQRIPPTPPPATDPPPSAPPKTAPRDGNQRPPATKNRANDKPTFQQIWNIPEKKPEIWANPPWGSSAAGPNTIDSGSTWDSEPVQPVHRERNANMRPPRENRSPVSRAPQARNTIDSGESWSPGGGGPQRKGEQPQQKQPSRTIDDGESWSPGNNKREQHPQRDVRQDRQPPPQFSARRSRSLHQVQMSNTIGGGDMWDLNDPPVSARKQPSPKRNVNRNPLLAGPAWDDDGDSPAELPSRISSVPEPDQRRRSRSPFRQRRSRSRSPGRRRGSRDRSLVTQQQSANQLVDQRNTDRSRSRDQRSQSPADRRATRPFDRRGDPARDRSPFGRQRKSRSRSPVQQAGFNRPPSRMPFRSERSRSPRPGIALSPSDMWDAGASQRRQGSGNPLLGGGQTWDDEIVPLGGLTSRSPPRLRESLLDHSRRYDQDRFSPNGRRRSSSRDRLLPERRNQRSPLREAGNRRWSRDRSPDRRKRGRSRSPTGWRRSMERSPVRRRRSISDHSPSYQQTLDYWKAVEDQEDEMERSSDRPNLERINEFGQSQLPERWEARPNDRDLMRRNITGRIDNDRLRANKPESRHQEMDDSQYSPSGAFDAISSDDECDFTNPRRRISKPLRKPESPDRDPYETIPLAMPSRSGDQLDRPFEHEASRDSLDSIQSFKEDEFSETPSLQAQGGSDERKNVLEHLKQRAENLKKLEEMKLARQKLLAQIKYTPQTAEVEVSKPNVPAHISSSERFDITKQSHPEPAPSSSNIPVVIATAAVPPANLVSKVDPSVNKPPAMPGSLLQIQSLPLCPPLPFGIAPPIPPLPSEAPPPPPPEEMRPPEPTSFVNTMVPPPSNAWNPSPPSFAPMPHIDVSQPPPNLTNPLLKAMPPSHYDPPEEESFEDRSFPNNNSFNPRFPPSNFMDKSQHERDFNKPPEDHPFHRMPSEENNSFNMGVPDFNAPNNHQRNRDQHQLQNRQQQQHNRFGGNRQFMQPQQQQQEQHRDPRQRHDGNVHQADQLHNNRGNNPRTNFNQNNQEDNFDFEGPDNSFNPNNSGNNFNNNRRNNFRNNNPGNNFRNNDSGDNFNDNLAHNFEFDESGNNFNRNNPGNNFNRGNNFRNNNPGNNFRNNNSGNNFNDDNAGNNFNDDNPGNNFDMDDSGNDFNFDGPGNNFNNNDPRNNFNKNNRGNFFTNNNRGNNFSNNNNPGNNFGMDDSRNNFDFDGPGSNFNDPRNNFNNNPGNNNPGNFFHNNRGSRGGRGGGRGRFNNNQEQQQRFNFQQQNRNPRFNNNRNNQQQQQQQSRFLMEQQEMFDESCFDMNALSPNDGGGDGSNWDDLM